MKLEIPNRLREMATRLERKEYINHKEYIKLMFMADDVQDMIDTILKQKDMLEKLNGQVGADRRD